MPEMPEVENIKRILEPQIVGESILAVTINHPQVIAYPDKHLFTELLTG